MLDSEDLITDNYISNMKNHISKKLIGLLWGCTMIIITSCNDEKKKEVDEIINNLNKPVDENPIVGKMSVADQKKKIDAAGQNLLDEINATDFKYLANLAEFVDDELYESDNKVITEWAENLLDQMSVKGKSYEEKDENYYYVDTYHYTDYTQLIILSNFTGHFTAENKKWSYSKDNDLQFSFKDQENKQVTLTIKTSGSYKDVHIGEEEDWENSEYGGYIRNKYYYDYYINVYDRTVRVPSNIIATLKQGSSVKSHLEVNIDISGMKSVDYDLANDSYSANSELSIGNYTIKNAKVAYNGNSNASISYSLSKGSKVLLAMSATADGNYSQESVKGIKIGIDVMGEIQIKGIISNGKDFIDYIDKAESYNNDEKKYNSNISLANDLLNLGVYYDGRNERQAAVKLECFHEYDRWSDYWYCEPVFYFGEESSYTAFVVFFGTGFDKLIAKYEKIVDDFEKLF